MLSSWAQIIRRSQHAMENLNYDDCPEQIDINNVCGTIFDKIVPNSIDQKFIYSYLLNNMGDSRV